MGNKSNTEKEYDRRTILATYLYDVSKLLISPQILCLEFKQKNKLLWNY